VTGDSLHSASGNAARGGVPRVPPLFSRLSTVVVIIVASLIPFSGIWNRLPLDSHEVYVARTAEEMLARNEWIIPYFNDQPRVRKPPLAYWLTMLIDGIGNDDGLISEVESRITPALSGVLLCIGVFMLGRSAFDTETGLIAALLAAAAGGFVTYTHSARPEMLYACFCTWAVVGFFIAITRAAAGDTPIRIALPAWFAWIMIGGALLAKGPQLPILLIAGFIIALFTTGRRVLIMRALHPFSGVALACAIAAWWYAAIFFTLPHAQDVWLYETIDRYTAWESKWHYLDPYYVYRTASLVLPWIVLYPFTLAAPWVKGLKEKWRARVLWWLLVIPLVALHVSLGRRWYYMLPALGPLAVLMAGVAVTHCRSAPRTARLVAAMIAILMSILAIAAIAWLHVSEPEILRPSLGAVAIVMLISSGATASIIISLRLQEGTGSDLVYASIAAWAAFFAVAAGSGSLWRLNRFERRAFALEVAQIVPHNAHLIAWDDNWEVEQYYAHRMIPSFLDRDALIAAIQSDDETFLLIEESLADSITLPPSVRAETLASHRDRDEESGVLLRRLVRTHDPERPAEDDDL